MAWGIAEAVGKCEAVMFGGWVSLLLNLLKLWPWRSLRACSFASVLSPSLSTTAELLRFCIFFIPLSDWFPNMCGLKMGSVRVPANWLSLTQTGTRRTDRKEQKVSVITENAALWLQLFMATWYVCLCVSPRDDRHRSRPLPGLDAMVR